MEPMHSSGVGGEAHLWGKSEARKGAERKGWDLGKERVQGASGSDTR